MFKSYWADTISALKFSKGHNSIKNDDGVIFIYLCALSDYMYICIKFRENISKGFRVIKWKQCPYSHFVKNICRITFLFVAHALN